MLRNLYSISETRLFVVGVFVTVFWGIVCLMSEREDPLAPRRSWL